MNGMKLRAEFVHDDEAGTWAFHVPGLHIVGGGDETREAAEKHCLDAIGFVFESLALEQGSPGSEVVDYDVVLSPAH